MIVPRLEYGDLFLFIIKNPRKIEELQIELKK